MSGATLQPPSGTGLIGPDATKPEVVVAASRLCRTAATWSWTCRRPGTRCGRTRSTATPRGRRIITPATMDRYAHTDAWITSLISLIIC